MAVLRRALATFFSSMIAVPAFASEIVIEMPEGVKIDDRTIAYQCPDGELPVRYVNAGSVSLAIFDWDGEQVVASNVVAASGARYAGGRYVWWTKGDSATLEDIMTEDDSGLTICEVALP